MKTSNQRRAKWFVVSHSGNQYQGITPTGPGGFLYLSENPQNRKENHYKDTRPVTFSKLMTVKDPH